MFIYNINPVLLKFGFLEVRYYGLVYVFGAFLAAYVLNQFRKKGFLDLSKDDVWDFIFWSMVGVVLGARLFMIFWQPEIYLLHPLELLKVWEGGLSFHGGLVGVFVAGYLFCKKKGFSFWKVADASTLPAIFTLALGRLANFTNGELWGPVTNVSWCVVYEGLCRHPYQIYAAISRFIVFGILLFWWLKAKDKKPGCLFWGLVLLEGVARFTVDFWRAEKAYAGLLLGQWFSLVMIVISVYILFKYYRDYLFKFS